MAEGGAVDLHEDESESVGHVLHQGGFAVAWGGNEEQHAHEVGSFAGPQGAHLFGQIVANQREVDLVDQPIAYEGGEDPGLELVESQGLALPLDDPLPERAVGTVAGDDLLEVIGHSSEEFVEAQGHATFLDARVLSQEAGHHGAPCGAGGGSRHRALGEQPGGGFRKDGCELPCLLVVGTGDQRLEPRGSQAETAGEVFLEGLEVGEDRAAVSVSVQLHEEAVFEFLGAGAQHEFGGAGREFFDEVGACPSCVGVRHLDAPRPQEVGDGVSQFFGEAVERLDVLEGVPQPAQVSGLEGDAGSGRLVVVGAPEQGGVRPGSRGIAEEAGVRSKSQEGLEDGGGVRVVDPPFVAFIVAGFRILAYRGQQSALLVGRLAEGGERKAIPVVLRVEEHGRGQEFAAVHLVVLRDQ